MHRGFEKILDKIKIEGVEDECSKTWNYNKKYITIINERNNWSYNLSIINNNWQR